MLAGDVGHIAVAIRPEAKRSETGYSHAQPTRPTNQSTKALVVLLGFRDSNIFFIYKNNILANSFDSG